MVCRRSLRQPNHAPLGGGLLSGPGIPTRDGRGLDCAISRGSLGRPGLFVPAAHSRSRTRVTSGEGTTCSGVRCPNNSNTYRMFCWRRRWRPGSPPRLPDWSARMFVVVRRPFGLRLVDRPALGRGSVWVPLLYLGTPPLTRSAMIVWAAAVLRAPPVCTATSAVIGNSLTTV